MSPNFSIRCFGWMMFALMVAYIINVVLTFWVGLPGVGQLFGWDTNGSGSSTASAFQLALYVAAGLLAVFFVLKTSARGLKSDAQLMSDFNAVFIRAAFWVVFLVGLADGAISFLRVEDLLGAMVGDDLAGNLGRSEYRGLYVHMPIVILGIVIAAFTRTLGFMWLALLVVLAELIIVFSRFVFSYEQAFMADLVRFWYGALFLFASAYTLLDDGHVRVDLLYASMRRQAKGRVNGWGAILLGIPLCWTILWVGMWSKTSVIVTPILVFEVTQSGFGMYVKYFMAGFLGVFAISMMMQFISQLFTAFDDQNRTQIEADIDNDAKPVIA
ncbi:MAG: TRAP transporter small permease subunit [Hyphomicrobiales bacterium]